MPENRARNYIERLPEIIPRAEDDVSHLDPEMLEILYPERASKEFTITVRFGPPVPIEDGDDHYQAAREKYERAVAIAQRSRDYRTFSAGGEGGRELRHSAVFGVEEVGPLHELFTLIGDFPSCELLVKGKKVPYARELWLPFFWFFKKDEA
jgi:hypothetical protein